MSAVEVAEAPKLLVVDVLRMNGSHASRRRNEYGVRDAKGRMGLRNRSLRMTQAGGGSSLMIFFERKYQIMAWNATLKTGKSKHELVEWDACV